MIVIPCVQGSAEWHALRVGKVTASRVAEIPSRAKSGGYRTSRANYLAEKIAERLTGKPAERFLRTAAIEWGHEYEPKARLEYAFARDTLVEETGFVLHPRIENFGASPDGVVTDRDGDVGLVEIKAPLTATHLTTLRSESVPSDYFLQIQAQLACTEMLWCDYVSYDPRLPEPMQLFVQRVMRDDDVIDMLASEVTLFLDDLEAAVDELRQRFKLEEVVF